MEEFLWSVFIILIIWAGIKGAKMARQEMRTGMEGKEIHECPCCNQKTAVPEEAWIDGETLIILHCKDPNCNARIKNWAGLRYDQKVQVKKELELMDIAEQQARAHANKKEEVANRINKIKEEYQEKEDTKIVNKKTEEKELLPEEVIANAVIQNKPDDLFKYGSPDESGDFYFLDIDLKQEERVRSEADVEDPSSYRGEDYDNGSASGDERDDAEISRIAGIITGKLA